MSIVACPRCRDEVTLPARISPQARVRCPLCRDEYTLSEALAKMPPMLIVLDAGPDADVGGYGEPEYKVAGDAAPAMGGVFDSSPAVGDAPAMPRTGVKAGARPKKKSGGGALSQIIQVELGGIGAFALFNPIAWYLMDQDPFSMGPIVAKYVPSVVPEKYRGSTPSGGANGKGSDIAKNGGNSKAPPVPDVVKNKKSNGSVFDTGDKFKGLDPNDIKPAVDPLDPGGAPAIPPEPEVMIDDPLNPKPVPVKPMVDKPVDFTPPMPKPVDPNAKPPVNTSDITTAYALAVSKREDFDASVSEESSVRKQKFKDLYEAAAQLGKLCAEADMMEAENADKVSLIKDELAMKMTGNGARLVMLAVFADPGLADGATEEGIAVGGVIKDFKDLGATKEMTIEVTRQNGTLFTLPIVTTKSLEEDGAKVGDKAIVLGKIVRDPKKDLPKYKGEAPQVIQAGHTTLVPAP
ncbi:MAG: hypothetical protein K8T89_14060 [Planctomycetes bacterium]|nr:hypothetical protein [Planctomycetota bacterium]